MAAPWTAKGAKTSPLAGLDEFMILDSQDGTPSTKNKRVTLATVQTDLVTNVNANTFNLVNIGALGIGTETPTQLLEIENTSGTAGFRLEGAGAKVTHSINTEYDINYTRTTGPAIIDIRALPDNGTSSATYRFGISSGSTGGQSIVLFEPNSSTSQTRFNTSGGNSFINSQGGNLGIGDSTPSFTLDVDGIIRTTSTLQINNPLNTFRYIITPSAILANRIATLPLLTADDTFAFLGVAQTFTGSNTFTSDVLLAAADGDETDIIGTVYSNAQFDTTGYRGRRARGTFATPLAVQNGDSLCEMSGNGYDGTEFTSGDWGFVEIAAAGTWTDAPNRPTKIILWTTPTGGTNLSERLVVGSQGETSFRDNPIQDIASILLNDSDDSHAYTILGGALSGDFDVTIPAITASDTFALLGVANTFTANQTITFADDTITNGLTVANTDGGFTFGNTTVIAASFAAQIGITTLGNTNGHTTDVSITPADTGTVPVSVLNLRQSDSTDVENRPLWQIQNNGTTVLTVEADGTLESTLPTGSIYVGDENNVSESFSAELETKEVCRAATTGSITLANLQTIDGVSLAAGNRVLVKNQNTSGAFPGNSANGIYIVVDGGAWTRSTDANTNALVNNGMFTKVTEGTVNVDTAWVLSTPDPIVLDTTKLVINEFSFADIATLNSDQTITGRKVFTQNVNLIETGGTAAYSATTYTNDPFQAGSFDGSRARGTETAPLTIQNDDIISTLVALGYDGTAFEFGAFIDLTAAGTWTVTSHPTKLQFFTTNASSTSQIEQFDIGPDGTANFEGNDIQNIDSINDSNGNELIQFPSAVASAVNEITISNAATGIGPTITSSGESNIDLNIAADGTGNINLLDDAVFSSRLQETQGSSVSSGTNITVGDGNIFLVTGTTDIDTMTSTGWQFGSRVTLYFNSNITINNATAADAFQLDGGVAFATTSGASLTVVLINSANGHWREVSRTVGV